MEKMKKLAKVAIVAAVLLGATAPASASVCEQEATSFETWFIKTFLCR